MAALLPEIAAAGHSPRLHTFHDGVVHFAGLTPDALSLHPAVVLMIDGYEQLSRWQRFRVRRACRQSRCGLVVTVHAPIGLPQLFRTTVTPDLAERVFAKLTEDRPALVAASDLRASLLARNNNLRDALFDLYDLHEQRRRVSECLV